jgi:hypothetical protein
MNIKRLIAAIVVGFIVVSGTDFLIHGVWLKPDYEATKSLWRPEAEGAAYMGWLLAAELLMVAPFVLIWAAGFAPRNCIRAAVSYGLFMGVLAQSFSVALYAVMPLPGDLVAKWFAAGVVQSLLLAIVTFFVYKPTAVVAKIS